MWSKGPSRNFDDMVEANRLGWVSWGGATVGPDPDGCNPALGPCQGITPARPTTWGRMKSLFRNP